MLGLGLLELVVCLILLSLQLKLLLHDVDARICRCLLRWHQLLQHLDRLLDDLWNGLEGLLGLLVDHLAGCCQHLVQRLLLFGRGVLLQFANVEACCVRGFGEDLVGVPQDHVFLDVLKQEWHGHWAYDSVATEHGVLDEVQVHLQVCKVILLRERDNRPFHRGRNVLVHRVQFQGLLLWHQQLLAVRYLQPVEEHLFDLAEVIQLRQLFRTLKDSLDLGKALGFARHVGVADRHHVHRTIEVAAANKQLASLVDDLGLFQVGLVQAEQQVQHTAHGIVHASMDGREDDHALLNAGQGCTDRGVRVAVCQLFERGPDDLLAAVNQKAKQLKQDWARWVVWHGHQHLADVVLTKRSFDLLDLGRVNTICLSTSP